jgi:hypothetical protein
MPALIWARIAVTLGRGLPVPGETAPANGSTTRVIAARAAFASGGARALEGWPADPLNDPDLRLYLAKRLPADTRGPVADYLLGVRARLEGDQLLAATKLHGALDGHADACRAAGEYVAAVRALGREIDLPALEPLRLANAGCAHLAPAALAAPKVNARRK